MNTPLHLAWCDYSAAEFACRKWHYSRSVPAGKTVKIGVWEEGVFTGAIIFGRGSNKAIGSRFGLTQLEAVELCRVALSPHKATVTKIVSVAIRLLKDQSKGLRLIVSYADPREGHIGAIYQAGNWVYVGTSEGNDKRNHPYKSPDGTIVHWRTMSGICGRAGISHTEAAAVSMGYIPMEFIAKHCYVMPLDKEIRETILPMSKPYPKRVGSIPAKHPANQPGEGGSTPTPTLDGGTNG